MFSGFPGIWFGYRLIPLAWPMVVWIWKSAA